MRVKTSSLIKGLLACLFLLLIVSVIHAADDTRFTLKDGVIDDAELGLQWVPAPDHEMNYSEAGEYAQNLSIAGGGWRLPTVTELKSLYDKSKPGGADTKFNISDKLVWTSEWKSDAWDFGFGDQGESRRGHHARNYSGYVLAVRNRK